MACCLPSAAGGADETRADQGTVNAVQSLASDYATHPLSEAEDIYKFLYQALSGTGHAVSSPEAAALSLEEEIASMGPLETFEPFCVVLGGDPILVRVHLRTFVAEGRDVGLLLDAFVATANETPRGPGQMQLAISLSVTWLQAIGATELATELEELEKNLRPKGYPAVSHSDTYREAYHPAYRVVDRSYPDRLGWCSK